MDKKKRKSNGISESQKLAKRQKYAELKSNPELYELQREKEKEKYRKKKLKKQVVSISEKSPREQRAQRKTWREAAKKYRQKKKEELKEIPLPEAIVIECKDDEEDLVVNKEGNTDSKVNNKKSSDPLQTTKSPETKIRRIRYVELKKRQSLLKIIQSLREQNAKLQKTINRYKRKGKQTGGCLKKPKKENESKCENLIQKKYTEDHRTNNKLIKLVRDFYNEDSNSTIAAGKKQFITRHKTPKQKRYLNNSLKVLHKKFISQHGSIVSYGFFCKYRPFWVVQPKPNTRDTCACIIHSNIDLIIECLNKNGIITEKNSQQVLQSLCCSEYNESCLERQCLSCQSRHSLNYIGEFSGNQQLIYYQWVRQRENISTKKGSRIQTITTKKDFISTTLEIIQEFYNKLPDFFSHCYRIQSQYNNIKLLKESLVVNEAVIHIDFSENYGLKFGKEVQSMHFGGSRKEVSLHTAVIYTFDFQASSIGNICASTISKCLRHDATAVWAHIIPLIQLTLENNPFIDRIHFVSDSPTSQYRNKFIFYIISNLWKDFPQLSHITWNYSEAGHGKGAPDGIGAVLKRTADTLVNFGKDIATFEQFVEAMQQNIENVKIIKVDETDITNRDTAFPSDLKSFKGTLAVHQVLWQRDSNMLTFRKVSCFVCDPRRVCVHRKHLGFLQIIPSNVYKLQGNENYVTSLESTRRNAPQVRVLTNITNMGASTSAIIQEGKASEISLIRCARRRTCDKTKDK